MFVNKITSNVNQFKDGFLNIHIPLSSSDKLADNGELIEKQFVNEQVELSINEIIDYEKTRFKPINEITNIITKTIVFSINVLDNNSNYVNKYSYLDFSDEDLLSKDLVFTRSFLELSFYDTDNPLTQRLFSRLVLYCDLNSLDFLSNGKVKPSNLVDIKFIIEDPNQSTKNSSEGFYQFYFKNDIKINEPKYLYMKAEFKNAKNGKTINLMINNNIQPIEELIKNLYNKVKFFVKDNKYYYYYDESYSNVNYSNDLITINLYEVKTL